MQIHLLDISSCDGKTIQESVIPELEKIDFQMGSFPVLAKEPVRLQWESPVTAVSRQ